MSTPFELRSGAEQVAAVLRDEMLRGELEPGTPLEEERVAAQFAVSRHTVREALQLLAAEHLVRRHRHRSVTVSELRDPAEVSDLYRARETIEVAAVGLAAKAGGDWLSEMEAALEAIGRSTTRTELDEADFRFHGALVSTIRSRRIDQVYRGIHVELRLVRGYALRKEVDAREVAMSHAPLIAALRDEDTAAAFGVLKQILASGEQSVLHALAAMSEAPAEASAGTDRRGQNERATRDERPAPIA